jgi:hypothetical protein
MAHWSQYVPLYYRANWIGHTTNPDGSIPGVTASMVCPLFEVVEMSADDRSRLYILLSRMYRWPISSIISPSPGLLKLPQKKYSKGVSCLPYVLSAIALLAQADRKPPSGYQIPPYLAPPPAIPIPVAGKRTAAPVKSLIDRYGLGARIPAVDKGKGKAEDGDQVGGQGQGKWEASKEERERGLRERKEKMVLEARR